MRKCYPKLAFDEIVKNMKIYELMRKFNPELAFDEIVKKMKILAEYNEVPKKRIPTKIRAAVLKAIFRKEGISVFKSDMVEKYSLEKC